MAAAVPGRGSVQRAVTGRPYTNGTGLSVGAIINRPHVPGRVWDPPLRKR